uniref:Ig-like domain-containing protein n=1 Tax=Maylandia zebra TaxID=106582 RepID=A0A3P9ARN6_9CICH
LPLLKQLFETFTSLLCIVSLSGQKNVTAESGRNVTLTCQARKNIQTVEWRRADLGDEYVFLYRDERKTSVHQHPCFKDRVDLKDKQMKDGDVSLILNNVTINDTGTYECRVVEKGTIGLKLISIITLTASWLLMFVSKDKPGLHYFPLEKSWKRSEHVLLYRDEQFEPDDQHPSFKNRVDLQDRQMKDGDMSLIVNNVTTTDSGTYECRVFMGGKERRKRAHLKTDPISSIYLKLCFTPAPRRRGPTARLPGIDLGKEYVLLYRDENFDPQNQYKTFVNRVYLQDRQMKDGNVTLILENVTAADNGTYECRVVQAQINHATLSRSDSSTSISCLPLPTLFKKRYRQTEWHSHPS